jgi:aminotransferase
MPPRPLAARMRALAQSDIRRMTLQCEAVGGVNLGQGVCDLPTLPELREGLARAVAANLAAYSRCDGIESLGQAVARRLAA